MFLLTNIYTLAKLPSFTSNGHQKCNELIGVPAFLFIRVRP